MDDLTLSMNANNDALRTQLYEQMFIEYDDIMTIDEMCKALHIGKSKAYQLLKENKIEYIAFGKKYIIPKISLIDFVLDSTYNKIADNSTVEKGVK